MIPTQNSCRLLLVDDHQIVREGLMRLLMRDEGAWDITGVSSGHEALERMRQMHFGLAIVDLSMPGMNGLDLIKRMKAEHRQTAVLVLSMHAEEQYALRAFKLGANGYVTKDTAGTELLTAARKVAAGGTYVSASMAERVVLQMQGHGAGAGHEDLTNRELDVLQRIVSGQRLTDIADALHLSVKTVSTHKARIQDKLQTPTMAALIRYGIDNGLSDVIDESPSLSP